MNAYKKADISFLVNSIVDSLKSSCESFDILMKLI